MRPFLKPTIRIVATVLVCGSILWGVGHYMPLAKPAVAAGSLKDSAGGFNGYSYGTWSVTPGFVGLVMTAFRTVYSAAKNPAPQGECSGCTAGNGSGGARIGTDAHGRQANLGDKPNGYGGFWE